MDPEEIYRRAREILRQEFPPPPAPSAPGCSGSGLRTGEPPAATRAGESGVIPARMLNEYIYCPRLFYYEHVEGVFVENAHTLRGSAQHQRVDKGSGALPQPDQPNEAEAASSSEPEVIHSRSVLLGSERLGVTAKMDLVEVRLGAGEGGDLFGPVEVCPVDYKAGAPREGEERHELWDSDRVQLGAQCLVLRDNGYRCREGIIYYRATKQRVRLEVTPEVENWILATIEAARRAAAGPIPPPLVASPKCPGCSLVTVCLPDETRLLAEREGAPGGRQPDSVRSGAEPGKVRRLMAARDDKRALYLNTPGWRVGRKDEVLQIKEKDRVLDEVRINDLSHLALFGNIQISTQAVQTLCENEVPLTYFSMGGWFYGITRGHELKNVFLRMEQFRRAREPSSSRALSRRFVSGKIRNQRTLLMRNHLEPPETALSHLKQLAARALHAGSLEELLGNEGAAAALYFQNFNGMLKTGEPAGTEDASAGARGAASQPEFTFNFQQRTRRPPTDPVNALLSLAYSLLAKDCTLAALAVGFDPYVGFYHQPRFGRAALGLDLMEEFRPLIADSAVLTCINNRVLAPKDFVRAGQAVNLAPAGRKRFLQIYEQRMSALLTHPVFDYKVSYRRAIELQARLLAKTVTGEIAEYVPLMTR